MGSKKRQMLYIPAVNPTSFVFFFEKGDTGLAWSIRDYSEKDSLKQYGRSDFRWTADQVREKAKYSFDAPTVDTNEIDYWHERTWEYNRTYLANLKLDKSAVGHGVVAVAEPTSGTAHAKEDKIGQYLKMSRRDHNQEDLARRAQVSPATISRIRKGQEAKKSIRVALANVISEELPCSPDDLLPSRDF
jgi:DNA-binding Xre family transcriptional regulator